jgi:hypothetical protein
MNAGGHPDSMNAAAKVEELKRKLLETNRQIVEIVEKQKTSDLLSTLDLYKSEMGQEGLGMVEREELRNELKLKEAKYFVAKAEYDKLDKEYKEYVEKHKQLEEQAKSIQEQVLSVLGFTGTKVQILTLLLLQPDPDSGKAEA